jgi:Holliday junction resolvase RusA-like endonuclease
MIELNLTCPGKPRMTKSDKWKKRPCVTRYWEFKDEIKKVFRENNYIFPVPALIMFLFPMPKTWTKKKKREMVHQIHNSKPDLDNCEKAICDALFDEDKHIYDVRGIKRWGRNGKIFIFPLEPIQLKDYLDLETESLL